MTSPWPVIRLGDVCSKIGSGATPRGGSDVYLASGEIALIRSQNIYNNRFEVKGLAYISQEHADELSNVEIQKNDVLLNITGDSVARCCLVPDKILPARVNQHVAIIRPDASTLNPRFLYFFLVSLKMQAHMLALASAGATRNALTKGMIENFLVPHPPIEIQNKVADILGALDKKIDLNRDMNVTLEATASAIFQSWLVNFDPVQAKVEGKQPFGMGGEMSALFPDSFEESEKGRIPKGWEVMALDQIANFLNGLALQKFPPEGDRYLSVIKIADMRRGNTEGSDRASADLPLEYVVHDGDVLFSWSGSLEVMLWCGGDGALNQHLFKVTSDEYPKWFYYLWTRHHLAEFQAIAAGKATTMGHIQRHHLSDAKVIMPPAPLLEKMSMIIAPLVDAQIRNNLESRTLISLRDTLLPKLLSGEVRLGNTVST